MNIFITGATGYIGNAVAKAFVQSGHKVFALARSPEKAQFLQTQEIDPIISSFEEFAQKANHADVIVHCAYESPESEQKMVHTLLSANPTSFLYTSGIYVYGNRKNPVNEDSNLEPIPIVAWRPLIEELVLNSDTKSVVIRPGCVYGYGKGLFAPFFYGAHSKIIEIPGSGKNHWPVVHVDDLARLYVLAAEHQLIQTILNATEHASIELLQFAEKLSKISNAKIIHLSKEETLRKRGSRAEGLFIDQFRVSSAKAFQLTNWIPLKNNLLKDLDHYFKTWQAIHQK